MPRRATGQIRDKKLSGGGRSFALRFRAYGKREYVYLGTSEDGWDREGAQDELDDILADVRRGKWLPNNATRADAPPDEPTFHEFASRWLEERKPELRPRTVEDYQWALSYHLLPAFADHRLSQITVAEIDGYKAAKLREGKLGPAGINKTLKRLAQILEVAVEYGHIERNPAKGTRRRIKEPPPARSLVEIEQIPALLEASDSWFRPIVATLIGTGLRVGEATALDWRDVNLATGTLTVRASKTDAGSGRQVDLPGGLIDELAEWKTRSPRTEPDDSAFVTRPRKGRSVRHSRGNIARRLKTTTRRANEILSERRIETISESVTPHSLRRTYASLRAALGDDPVYIAEQLGHEDARFTFRVYQKAAKRRERLSGNYLEAFDSASDWALMGTGRSEASEVPTRGTTPQDPVRRLNKR